MHLFNIMYQDLSRCLCVLGGAPKAQKIHCHLLMQHKVRAVELVEKKNLPKESLAAGSGSGCWRPASCHDGEGTCVLWARQGSSHQVS